MRTRLIAILIAATTGLAIASVWPLLHVWHTQNHNARVVVVGTWFAEFSLVMTAISMGIRGWMGKSIPVLLILSSLFLWEMIPGSVLLGLFSIFVFPGGLVILFVILALAVTAWVMISDGLVLGGTAALVVPMLFVAGVSFYRPWTPGSVIWPIAGGLHVALAVSAGLAMAWQIRCDRRMRTSVLANQECV